MAHFAKIEKGIVVDVVVADQGFIDTLSGNWVQTSYNTRGGVHYGTDGQPDGGVALRGNYAGIGYIYDAGLDAFYPPKPNALYQLNNTSFTWEVKPEYSPLVAAALRSPLSTLPTGAIGNTIVVDGTTIRTGQNVLFTNLTTDPGVYTYTGITGSFVPVPNNTSLVVFVNNYSTIYRYVNAAWVSETVQE